MAAKLKLALKTPVSLLAFKAAVFGLLLFWLGQDGGLAAAVALVVGAAWLYFRPLFNATAVLWPFLILLFFSFWLAAAHQGPVFSYLIAAFLAFLFFIILGLKNLVLVRRVNWRIFLDVALIYLAFLSFFVLDKPSFYFLSWGGFLVIDFLLLMELLTTIGVPAAKIKPLSGVLTLIIGELTWVASWLPIGFLALANTMLLVVLLFTDLLANYFSERLNLKLIIKDLALFIMLLAIVLLTARWTL